VLIEFGDFGCFQDIDNIWAGHPNTKSHPSKLKKWRKKKNSLDSNLYTIPECRIRDEHFKTDFQEMTKQKKYLIPTKGQTLM